MSIGNDLKNMADEFNNTGEKLFEELKPFLEKLAAKGWYGVTISREESPVFVERSVPRELVDRIFNNFNNIQPVCYRNHINMEYERTSYFSFLDKKTEITISWKHSTK